MLKDEMEGLMEFYFYFLWDHSFTERIDKELHALLPPYMSNGIRVVPPPYGADTPWFGAKIIGNVSSPLLL